MRQGRPHGGRPAEALALGFAAEELECDTGGLMAADRQNPPAPDYAAGEPECHKDVLMVAVRQNPTH